MEKSKTSQKGAGKQQSQPQRPGSEQSSSGTHIQRGQEEQIQKPKQGEQLKHKQGQSKTTKK